MESQTSENNTIKFRSELEEHAYNMLLENELEFAYEPFKITLLEHFRPRKFWFFKGKPNNNIVRKHTYTPDFVVYANNTRYFIEMKGLINERYPLQRKLVLAWLQENDGIFCECRTLKQLQITINLIKENAQTIPTQKQKRAHK